MHKGIAKKVTLAPDNLEEIFFWVKILSGDECKAAENVLAISGVCTTWRTVIHAMPKLWQVVSLSFRLTYASLRSDRPYSSIGLELEKLRHYAQLSHNYPLAIRVSLPALPFTSPSRSWFADSVLMGSIWYITRGLAEVSERIDQLTAIAPNEQTIDYMSYALNHRPWGDFDPSWLFLNARVVQFLYEDDVVDEKPLEPVPSSLPAVVRELVLIRPVHQWWKVLGPSPQTSRFSATTSVIFHRPMIPYVTRGLDWYLLKLLSIVSGTLRSLELRDDSTPDYFVENDEIPFWEVINLKMDHLRVVCAAKPDWVCRIIPYLNFSPQSRGRLILTIHGSPQIVTTDFSPPSQ